MQPIKYGKLLLLCAVLFAQQTFSAVYTVSQTAGAADFTSIQAAVNKASVNDEIIIKDLTVYKEQVTIDSTKSGLILRSENIYSLKKPTIEFQDTKNVNPKTPAEATKDATINFDRNGALQILGAKRVRIEGIAVSGSKPYIFGANGIWNDGKGQMWPLQHGNGGITLWIAGDCIIRYCDIFNSFFGINVKDRNIGGVFANPNPADIDSLNIIPFSGFAQTGNHVFEYNRIHNNSFGMYFESSWDLGSTIRYNLFYENHHQTETFATSVAGLTTEGANMPGGAIMTKDNLLSPLAIYNNTFWHNLFIFVGVWKAGGQHLIFNNIYAEPYVYYQADEINGGKGHLDMFKSYANRMFNCVIAAQVQKPTANYISITNDISSTPALKAEGDVVNKPFPASADIRYLESHFLSIDPTSAQFLEPDWSNALVAKYIVDKGWAGSGVKDPDGSLADLGAIPSGGGRFVGISTIRPTGPVTVTGTTATVRLSIVPRIDEIKNIKFTLTGVVRNLDTGDVFGSAYVAIPATNIQKVTVTTTVPLKEGSNEIKVTVPASLGDFAFLEFIVEGTDSDDQPYTSAVGFIPYRYFPYVLKVTIQDEGKTKTLTEVKAGTPVNIHVEPQKLDGTVVQGVLSPLALFLGSNYDLFSVAGIKIDTVISTKTGALDIPAVFHIVPAGNTDNVTGAGQIGDIPFIGSSNDIKILAGDPDSVKWYQPKSKQYDTLPAATAIPALARVFDKYGNLIKETPVEVKCVSTLPNIGEIIPDNKGVAQTEATTGVAQFITRVTNGDKGEVYPIVASLANGKTDTAYMVVGEAKDAFRIYYGDTTTYDATRELRGCSGLRFPVVIRAVKSGTGVLSPDKENTFQIVTSIGLAVFETETATTPISSSKLTAGQVRVWVQGTLKNVTNGTITALQNGNVATGDRSGIYFEPCLNSIATAVYFADNGVGSVNRLEVYYLDSLSPDQVPDSFDLFWPVRDPANKIVVRKDAIVLDPLNTKHLTLTITPPFAPGSTRIIGSAQLGTSYWYNTKTTGAPVNVENFNILDGVGPLVASAILVERLSAGDDTILVSFTENVAPEVVTGISLYLKTPGVGAAVPLTVISALPGGSGTTVKVVVSGAVGSAIPKEGDSLSIIPTGPIVDGSGNHAYIGNRFVPITLQPVPADIKDAVYLDRDADGNVDVVRIIFLKSVDPTKTAIQLNWDGVKQAGPDFSGDALIMVGTDTVEILIADTTFGYKRMQYKTSGSMQVSARFLLFQTDNTRQGVARDGAAPVIKEVQYHKGKFMEDETTDNDTLFVKYTEPLVLGLPNTSQKQPVLFGAAGSPITYTSSIGINQNLFHMFIVPQSQTPKPAKGDSAWINVALEPENNAKDLTFNFQVNPANRRVRIDFFLPPFKLEIKAGPSPFIPTAGQKVTVRMKAKTGEADTADLQVTMTIYDKVGNIVKSFPNPKDDPLLAGTKFYKVKNSLEIPWDGTNAKGRYVGSGTYLCVVKGTISSQGTPTTPIDEKDGKLLIAVQSQ